MPRKKVNQRLAIYDNNIKLGSVATVDEIKPMLRQFGYEAAVHCDVSMVPEQDSYMAMKLEPVRGKHEVHHIVVVKE